MEHSLSYLAKMSASSVSKDKVKECGQSLSHCNGMGFGFVELAHCRKPGDRHIVLLRPEIVVTDFNTKHEDMIHD